MKARLWLASLALAVPLAHAAIDTYAFANDAERERFTALTRELRCPKCQNQDIADSNAPIAADLRREILRLLGEGKSDREITEYMVDRYGEFIRYTPALGVRTGLLWFGPAVLLAAGAGVIGVIVRRRRTGLASPETLSPDERERLARLLDEHRP